MTLGVKKSNTERRILLVASGVIVIVSSSSAMQNPDVGLRDRAGTQIRNLQKF
jgi:hypothetical protein